MRDFHDSLLSLDNDDWLLDYPVNDHMLDFDVILNLFGSYDLNLLDYLFTDPLDFNDFRYTNDFFHDLLNIIRNFNDLFYNLLDMDNLFPNDFDLSILDGYVINNLTDCNWLLDLNNLFDVLLHDFNFRNFFNHFNDSLNNGWHLDHFFNNLFDLNDLLNDSLNDNGNFNRHWDLFLNLSDLLDLNDLLYYLFNSYDLGDLDQSIDNLFNDLFNLDYLRNNSENFENVIDVDASHDLLIDHSDNSLVDL